MTARPGLAIRCLAALLALPATLAAAVEKQPFSAERSWQLHRVAAPTISSDGKWAVVAIAKADLEQNKLSSDLWIYATDGSVERPLTSHAADDTAPLFSPDGATVAFISQRDGDTTPQIYTIAIAGGEATRVTRWPTGVGQIKWSPDGAHLYFISRVWTDLGSAEEQGKRSTQRNDAKMKAQVYEGKSFSAWDTLLDDREFHLFRVPRSGGEPAPITLGTGLHLPRQNVQLESVVYDVSPDGGEIAFVADADPAVETSNQDVFVMAAAGGAPRNLTGDNVALDGSPLYSPDGAHLAFESQRIPKFYADMRRLMVLDRASGKVREVAADWDRSKTNLAWTADGQRLIGAIDDAGTVRLYEVALDGKPRAITTSPSFTNPALAKSGTLVALRQSFLEPPTLVRVELASGSVTQLSTVNDRLLADTSFGTYESVTYPGADGASIQMWVNYPPGFDRSRKHPLFLLIHGGPHNGQTDGMQFRWNAQVFSSWGFVTAWPNFHGSSGFGQAFTDSINPQWDALPYADVIAAAEWLSAQPWIDRERMVAGGGSYGGYLTSIILGRPHPFKALVAHAAVYNLYTQYGNDTAIEIPRFGGFWEPQQQEVLRTSSPHYAAASFATPTLVIHGQKDMRVPVNQGIELYQTLLMKGVPTKLIYFPDENHWILKPQNSLFWYAEVRSWLERWIVRGDGASRRVGFAAATRVQSRRLMPLQPGDRVGAYEILSDPGCGRDGCGVSRARRQARARRRDQDAAGGRRRRSRTTGPLRARSADAGGAQPPQHRHRLWLRAGRCDALPDHGGGRGRDTRRSHRARPHSSRAGAAALHPDRRGSRGGARQGHHPPRPQAGQHQDRGRRRIGLRDLERSRSSTSGWRRRSCRRSRRDRSSASHSPTLTLQATMRGEILGTAAYMSPEQAQGLPADQRADIWAFGVCLLEALSGRRVFSGANASFVLASVLKDEPDFGALPPSTPPVVRRLLRRCLEKNRERRLHDIGDARLELEEALAAPAAEPEPVVAAARGARRLLDRNRGRRRCCARRRGQPAGRRVAAAGARAGAARSLRPRHATQGGGRRLTTPQRGHRPRRQRGGLRHRRGSGDDNTSSPPRPARGSAAPRRGARRVPAVSFTRRPMGRLCRLCWRDPAQDLDSRRPQRDALQGRSGSESERVGAPTTPSSSDRGMGLSGACRRREGSPRT